MGNSEFRKTCGISAFYSVFFLRTNTFGRHFVNTVSFASGNGRFLAEFAKIPMEFDEENSTGWTGSDGAAFDHPSVSSCGSTRVQRLNLCDFGNSTFGNAARPCRTQFLRPVFKTWDTVKTVNSTGVLHIYYVAIVQKPLNDRTYRSIRESG